MASNKEYQSYADCIGCKSNNIIDILRDYIVKYEKTEELKKYNLKKEDLLGSIRFMLSNLEDEYEYYQVLIIAIGEGIPEITRLVLDQSKPISKLKQEEVLSNARTKAKKSGPKQKNCKEIVKMLEEHEF